MDEISDGFSFSSPPFEALQRTGYAFFH